MSKLAAALMMNLFFFDVNIVYPRADKDNQGILYFLAVKLFEN
jgi:hypothetical protein